MLAKKCISQMCVCGRHRCPKKYLQEAIRPSGPQIAKLPPSEYTDEYKRFDYAPPRNAIRPIADVRPPSLRMETETTHTGSYRPFPISVPDNYKPKVTHTPPPMPVSDLTVHKESYKPWDAEDIALCRGETQRPWGALPPTGRPFTATSTFQDDFRPPQGVTPVRGKGQVAPPTPEGMYYMDTTHQTDFTPQPINVRTPYKQMGQHIPPPPFKGTSVYQSDYKPPPWVRPDSYGMQSAPSPEASGWERRPSVKTGVDREIECKTCYDPGFKPQTTYQDSYRCPIGTVCPAALIHSTSSSGEPLYRHVGTTMGHEYFVRAA